MSALVPLHHMASAVVVRTLMDHNDQHSPECKAKAQTLITKLNTNLYTAVSKDLLDLFVDSYPRQLPAFLLPVLAPPHLRVLNLKQCCLIEEDAQAGFKYLKETLRSCSKLQSLVLDGCNLVLPLLLCDIITQNALQLVSISVEECRGVSNEFVQKLLRGLLNLSQLNISICPEVTDSVFALSETQGLLEERNLKQDSACGGCNLNSVDLSGNQQLTSTCIRHLTELCGPRLRNLNVAATRMDCTILWFLSGYSLSTAVQLAAEANKAVMDGDSSSGETLAQLITEFRVLQERLKNLQEEECQRQEEMDEMEGKGIKTEESRLDDDDIKVTEEDEMESGLRGEEPEQIKELAGGCLEDARKGMEETARNGLGDDGRIHGVFQSVEVRSGREMQAQSSKEQEEKIKDAEIARDDRSEPKKDEILGDDVSKDMEETQDAARGSLVAQEGSLQETRYQNQDGNQSGNIICKEQEKAMQDASRGRTKESEVTQEQLFNQLLKDNQILEPEDEVVETTSVRNGHRAVAGDSELSVSDSEGNQGGKAEMREGPVQQQLGSNKNSFMDDLPADGSPEESGAALGHFVNDIIADCSRRVQHEIVTQGYSCVHSPDLCQSRAGEDISHESTETFHREASGSNTSRIEAGIWRRCPQCEKLQESSSDEGGRHDHDLGGSLDDMRLAFTGDRTVALNVGAKSSSDNPSSLSTDSKLNGHTMDEREGCFCGDEMTGKSFATSDETHIDGRTFSRDDAQNIQSIQEITSSAVPQGSRCHSRSNRTAKLTPTDSANGSDCLSSHLDTSANERPDSIPDVEYSNNHGASSNQLPANSANHVCKLKTSDSANRSGCKSCQPAGTANETREHKKATVYPWRRLYTPCITSLDMSIIDFDATLVTTCLKEFFVANSQLKKLTVCWKELTDSMLEIIASGGVELLCLCLVDCSSLTNFGVAHLLSKCRKLRQLDLQGVCYIADTALMPIFLQGNSCNLHSLKLSETNISDSTLTRIAKYLGKKITTLEISWCEEISDSGLAEIAKHCTSLETLTLRQCSMSADTLMSLAWNCTRLASLNMSGVENLTDGVAQAMVPSLRHLTKLDVSWNSELTNAAISSVLSCCPLMVELYLMGLKRITEKPFMPIISELARWQRCKKLIKLKIKERTLLQRLGEEHFSSDEEYEDLFSPVRSTSYAPCLRILELHYCDRVNDDLLAELVAICVGTLAIVDYYGMQIKPKLLKRDSSDI